MTRKPPIPKSKAKLPPPPPITKPSTQLPPALPPTRIHDASYHWPLLLSNNDGDDVSQELLGWFKGIEEKREMPWRKKWINPKDYEEKGDYGKVVARRAYEVWVSEIMLQQTRVSTVIPYFNTWISKWPTVYDLADADHDDVLAAWKGLGYYSRATRLHQGAKDMVTESEKQKKAKDGDGGDVNVCPIPSSAEDLQKFSGIGRYTAGAISSIAFGESEPVLDGNVVRVLSRQMGLYIDAKDKSGTDLLWFVADGLVKHVSGLKGQGKSEVPGLWNQALMELGSTVCTPRPKCEECPIQATCRVYKEGEGLVGKKEKEANVEVADIEDACTYCEQLDTEELTAAVPEDDEEQQSAKSTKKRKGEVKDTKSISSYFTTKRTITIPDRTAEAAISNAELLQTSGNRKRKTPESGARSKAVATYCSLFPKKVVKNKVAEEECVVCMVEVRMADDTSKWLIEQRPAKGLLASLWQFPQCTLAASSSTASYRKSSAQNFLSNLEFGHIDMSNIKYTGELGSLVHVFSHLKLTMHVQSFRLDLDDAADLETIQPGPPKRKWIDTAAMDNQTLSTGMRRCWALVNT